MEDIWYFGFGDQAWIEIKPLRTKLRGVCPPAENVQAIKGAEETHWSYPKFQRSTLQETTPAPPKEVHFTLNRL